MAGIHISFATQTGEVLLRRLESGPPQRAGNAARTAHRSPGAVKG
jgi:hypothetical protein